MESKGIATQILDGISSALDGAFPEVKIYADEVVEQGLDPPAFFITFLPMTRRQGIGPKCRLLHPFDIQYFPEGDGSNAELLDTGERLFSVLEYIQASGQLVRGTGMSSELVDGVLHFFVSYNISGVRPREQEEAMRELVLASLGSLKNSLEESC